MAITKAPIVAFGLKYVISVVSSLNCYFYFARMDANGVSMYMGNRGEYFFVLVKARNRGTAGESKTSGQMAVESEKMARTLQRTLGTAGIRFFFRWFRFSLRCE